MGWRPGESMTSIQEHLADMNAAGFDRLIGRPDRWARLITGATVAGLLFGLMGPYNSFAANPATRLFYWVLLFWAGTLILWPSAVLAASAGARRGFPPIFAVAAAILISSIPLAGFAAAGCYVFWPIHASGIRPLEWYVQTLVVALPATAIALWLEMGRNFRWAPASTAGRIQADTESQAPSGFAGGPALPDHLIDAALCLQMEDHHVRVHTVGRSYLHLAPLKQVAEQLGSSRGLQVHRSWWVAHSAVREWREEGRSIVLILSSGQRVPVARNRVAQLRALGWLNRA
jgi:hypothetical protein